MSNVYPTMTPMYPGPALCIPQAMNYGGYPTHCVVPNRQPVVIPRPVMIPPPPYLGHGLTPYLQQPIQLYQPSCLQPLIRLLCIPIHPPNMMAPIQTTYRMPAKLQVTVHTTAETNTLSTKTQSTFSFNGEPIRTAIQPSAVEMEQNLPDERDQMEMDTDEVAVQSQQANQQDMESPIIIQESQPVGTNSLPTLNSSTEAEASPLDTEPMENTMCLGCESSAAECTNPEPVHSEILAPGKSDSKTHFLEIPGLKEIPPNVDLLRTVVCTIQTRL